MSVLMAATAAILFALGTYLLLQRKLSRIIIGIGLLGHGANVLFVNAGRRGRAPLIGSADPDTFADPMPQALVLTAIVISFGVTALLLALAYRSWVLTEDDEVADDVEDRSVAKEGFADSELEDEAALVADLESSTEDDEPAPIQREVGEGVAP
ncbi:MAG TPA: NADH-quinone oxidoreductase subunit K [Iamia sp.]|nr:NADH-quinone oxidoreductase subunit K [Iamia sp.]